MKEKREKENMMVTLLFRIRTSEIIEENLPHMRAFFASSIFMEMKCFEAFISNWTFFVLLLVKS